jgi:UrcA family protein
MIRTPFAAAVILSLFTALPLAARAADTSVAVHAGDLDLATDSGQAVLQHRIAHAVNTVCGMSHPRTTAEAQAYAACSASARASATAQFDTMVAAARDGQKVMAGGKAHPAMQ